jgi:5-methylcytosine-specific restriction endonuclease McrA
MNKKCSICLATLAADASNFRSDSTRSDGLSYKCKPCAKKGDKAYRVKRDKNKQAEHARAWREANPDYQKAWREKNVSRHLDYNKAWRANNPNYNKDWIAARPGYCAAIQRKLWAKKPYEERLIIQRAKRASRRHRIARTGKNYNFADVKAALSAQKNTCWWCSKRITKYHIDHRIPLARGGGNGPDNIVISCPKCNLSRGAKLPWEGPSPRLL